MLFGKIPIGTIGNRPAWAEGLEVGSTVGVRYDPAHPKNASIIKGEAGEVENRRSGCAEIAKPF